MLATATVTYTLIKARRRRLHSLASRRCSFNLRFYVCFYNFKMYYCETDPVTNVTTKYARHFQQVFPEMVNDRIAKVLKGEKPDRIPVWLLGQTEFERREQGVPFSYLYRRAKIISELTFDAVERFDYDAAVIFNHVSVIPDALGCAFKRENGTTPVLVEPLKAKNVDKLNVMGVVDRLYYVGNAINMTRTRLAGRIPVIGYSEGPWTTMCYLIEGNDTEEPHEARAWLYRDVGPTNILLALLRTIIVEFLVMQVDAGAQVLHLSETNAGCLNKYCFETYCLPYLKEIRLMVKQKLDERRFPHMPIFLYVKGASNALLQLQELGYDGIGLDHTIAAKDARKLLGADAVLQGNFDACASLTTLYDIKPPTIAMVKEFGVRNYIANLGESMYPLTSPNAIRAFVDAVHSYKVEK